MHFPVGCICLSQGIQLLVLRLCAAPEGLNCGPWVPGWSRKLPLLLSYCYYQSPWTPPAFSSFYCLPHPWGQGEVVQPVDQREPVSRGLTGNQDPNASSAQFGAAGFACHTMKGGREGGMVEWYSGGLHHTTCLCTHRTHVGWHIEVCQGLAWRIGREGAALCCTLGTCNMWWQVRGSYDASVDIRCGALEGQGHVWCGMQLGGVHVGCDWKAYGRQPLRSWPTLV